MRAMVLEKRGGPLELRDIPAPRPGAGQILIRVGACGVCRTDLHVMDGDLPDPKLPLVMGHQIVGVAAETGVGAKRFAPGDRVGVPWLGGSCGRCRYCREGRENLCDGALYTGYQIDGGFAEYCAADEGFCFPVPAGFGDAQAAPLLCAGLIGYRALAMTECPAPSAGGSRAPETLGFYGFGSSAHILIQVAAYRKQRVFAFTRPGDEEGRRFARGLGAVWAGGSTEAPPEELDAAIIFAPVGELLPAALAAVRKGGVVVCAGIHMSDIPSFPYSLLWGERVVRSVANLTRRDGEEFLALAAKVPVETEVHTYPLERAGEALADLREGRFTGSAVVVVGEAGGR
ncbi:MAG: zinc-dependent alcohol dehydrogenase family protein [Planctomycetota bacterium]|jgi:propanol-preferring alcohol dehydrogenase